MTARTRLDLVLSAFHTKLHSPEDATERYLAALRLSAVHILAHPTGRMFGRRTGLRADWPRVFGEAARLGKALEIDATMWRQDLNVPLTKLAVAEGAPWFSIGSDAHSAKGLRSLPIGMAIAAIAGVPPDSVLNFRSQAFVRDWARALDRHAGQDV